MSVRDIVAFSKAHYLRIDFRSLALFRILWALLLLGDGAARWPYLEAFYTENGVLPVAAPLPKSGGAAHFSLLDYFGSLDAVRICFGVGFASYVMLLLGWQTRLAHLLSVAFYVSVLNRNGLVHHAGDAVMLTLLLWSFFLPLNRRFSIDARRRSRTAETSDGEGELLCRPTLAAFSIISQIGLIYLFTAVAKSGSTWKDGTALYYALNFDQWTRPAGQWLASQPLLVLKTLTELTLVLEFLAFPLILLQAAFSRIRWPIIGVLVIFHLGIWATMDLGLFPFVMIAAYSLFLRPEDWDRLPRVFKRWRAPRAVENGPADDEKPSCPSGRSFPRVAREVVVAFALGAMLIDGYNLNLARRVGTPVIELPLLVRGVLRGLQVANGWDMFAPNPPRNDGWWVADGLTRSGAHIDPMTGGVPTYERPQSISGLYGRLWRKYLYRVSQADLGEYRPYLAAYWARKYEAKTGSLNRLQQVEFYYIAEITPRPGTPKPWPFERVLLWEQTF